jgi:LCP family protein required for cell wall assembly
MTSTPPDEQGALRRDRSVRRRVAKKSRRPRTPEAEARRRRRRPWLIGGTIAALAGLATLVGYPLFLAVTFESQSTDIPNAFPEERLRPPEVEGEGARAVNILLLGSDTRGTVDDDIDDIRGQRSDTMLLMHVPADRSGIQVMSIMRDSWVTIPGYGENKINAALAFGGVPLVVQTLEGLLEARIHRVAIIDFEGFGGMTEALGGVTLTNSESFRSSGVGRYQFPAGEITVSGDEALAFLRERKAFQFGDYQRVRNQQAFMKGLLSGVLNAETLTNPARIAALVNEVSPYVSVDSDFSISVLASLGYELRDVRVSDVTLFTMPTTGTGTRRGQSVVVVDEEQLDLIQAAFQSSTFMDYVPPPPPL